MSKSEDNFKGEFKNGLAKGAGCAVGGALICGVIGLIFTGPAGGIVGLKIGAGLGGGGGTIT